MKIVKNVALLLCVGGTVLTTGCRAFTSLFPMDNDPGSIETTGWIAVDKNSYSETGPGLGQDVDPELTATEWMPVEQFDDASRSADEWEPIVGKLGFPTVYFAYNQDRIGSSERSKLDSISGYMLQYKSIGLIVEGHCDERGSAEFNRALGERRAIAVKDYLVSTGVPVARLKTISFGEERPVVSGTSPDVLSKNRRAELVPAKM